MSRSVSSRDDGDADARFMLRKLYSAVSGASCPDNPDSPQHHEVLLPGYLYGMIIKERMEEGLNGIKAQIAQDIRQGKDVDFGSSERVVGRLGISAHGRDIFPEDPAQGQLGHRIQAVVLPRHGEPRLADRSRPATNVRIHHRR